MRLSCFNGAAASWKGDVLMSPIGSAATDLSLRRPFTPDHPQAMIEVPYCDVRSVKSFAVSGASLAGFSPGDQIYLRSGVHGAYRTVLAVETISDGSVIIVLEPSRAEKAAMNRYGSTAGMNLEEK